MPPTGAKMETMKTRIENRLNGFLAQERMENAHPALLGMGHYIATADGSSTVRIDGGTARLVRLEPCFIGSTGFSRTDADSVLAIVNDGTWGALKVVHRNELRTMAIANCRAMLVILDENPVLAAMEVMA